MAATITALETSDVRFPTSELLDGSDAVNVDPDYSAAYAILRTDAHDGLEGHGFAFTTGRGTEVQVAAIDALAPLVVGLDLDEVAGRHCRPLAPPDRRQPAALARAREGRRPHGRRGGDERGLGPLRQARGRAAVAAAGAHVPRADRGAGRLPLPDRRPHTRRGAGAAARARAGPRRARAGAAGRRAGGLHDLAGLAGLQRRQAPLADRRGARRGLHARQAEGRRRRRGRHAPLRDRARGARRRRAAERRRQPGLGRRRGDRLHGAPRPVRHHLDRGAHEPRRRARPRRGSRARSSRSWSPPASTRRTA